MGLAERTPTQRTIPGRTCAVGFLRAALTSDDERAALDGWLCDPMVSPGWIADQLSDEFRVDVEWYSVARHRRGGCKC